MVTTFVYFLFGWHVHEKAILPTIILSGLLISRSAEDATLFWLLSITGTVGLFPLLFTVRDEITEILLTLSYLVVSWWLLKDLYGEEWRSVFRLADKSIVLLVGVAFALAYCVFPAVLP